ncbi:hypothetical protein EAH81_21100 [Flavobacterium pectinovorum]|uniref:Uncharacterized protein n=1 Tax=Flavobacterium pectinovorum TaxID=29533 RepID=A0A502ECW6_9FLAO|nr:hypothetical protein EAH81_21100 [Flavobacterium pectinovorum]
MCKLVHVVLNKFRIYARNLWGYKLGVNFTAKHAKVNFILRIENTKFAKLDRYKALRALYFLNKLLDEILACFAVKLFTIQNILCFLADFCVDPEFV